MSMEQIKCTTCGAALHLEPGSTTTICVYCNTQYVSNASAVSVPPQLGEEPKYNGTKLSTWLTWLSSPDPRQFRDAADAIEYMGDAAHTAVPTIIEVIKRYPDRACRAIEIFQYLGRTSETEEITLPSLRDLLRTSPPDIQEAILGTMAYIGDADDAERVFDYLKSPYLPVRLKAIWLLGVPGPHYERALHTVEDLLSDPNERVRSEARRAMRNLRDGFQEDRPLD